MYIHYIVQVNGNLFYLEDNDTSILIDVGVSFKSVCLALDNIGKKIDDVSAILITHEHSDHIKGLPTLCKKINIPIYTCNKTKEYLNNYLKEKKAVGNIIGLEYNDCFQINNLNIDIFETSHDAAQPCGFHISNGKTSLTFATDLGYISDKIYDYLNTSDLIVLESNYDKIMLEYGNYPFYLKKRISSDTGHLSNTDAAQALTSILSINPNKKILLSHLSENNNTVNVAKETVCSCLKESGIDDANICVATQDLSFEWYSV
ncbi:MAG: MBL fold metallo-hydrolase [Clostridia bacterium]